MGDVITFPYVKLHITVCVLRCAKRYSSTFVRRMLFVGRMLLLCGIVKPASRTSNRVGAVHNECGHIARSKNRALLSIDGDYRSYGVASYKTLASCVRGCVGVNPSTHSCAHSSTRR